MTRCLLCQALLSNGQRCAKMYNNSVEHDCCAVLLHMHCMTASCCCPCVVLLLQISGKRFHCFLSAHTQTMRQRTSTRTNTAAGSHALLPSYCAIGCCLYCFV